MNTASAGEKRLIQYGESRQWMTEAQVMELGHAIHEAGRCGTFMDITDHAAAYDRGIPEGMSSILWGLEQRDPSQGDIVNRVLPELKAANIYRTVEKLSSFPTRQYRSQGGVQAAQWIRDQFAEIAKARTDVTVDFFKHAKWDQPSVIARIQGTDPSSQETVIIGAHEDSVNWSDGPGAPGADDDASGVATLMEAFRGLIVTGYQPRHSIEFITYSGEELGLLGSQDIAQAYQKAGRKIRGVFQLDMTMYPGKSRLMTLISDHTDRGLTVFVEKLIDTYVKAPWREDQCGYACSDHASWTKAGYPSAFPFEALFAEYNRKIHTTGDTLSLLDAEFGLNFSKLAAAFLIELGSSQ